MGTALALGLLALLLAEGESPKPHLSALELALDGPRVLVTVELVDAFDDELVERIQTGLPSGYDYQFRLLKDFKFWWDQDVDSTTLQVFATYDAVSREYLVNYRQDGRLIQSRVLGDLQELERAMTRFEAVHVFTLDSPPPRRRLLVRARVKLGDGTFLKFIPTTEDTPWVESRKFRPPAPAGGTGGGSGP
jgi:hypothetical protein